VKDKRLKRLINGYLKAGVVCAGKLNPTDKGTPQGGSLSPFLSNVLLDDLDKELERRGHSFCRCADDVNIYVRTKRAGERTMRSITRFVEGPLKLKVNQEKSAVARPLELALIANSRRGPWWCAGTPAVTQHLSPAFFRQKGLLSLCTDMVTWNP
jgi:retron-type reverse transcriptase